MDNQKTAFITGANKGIGFQTAKDLGAKGYKILLGARNNKRGQEACDALAATGVNAEFIQLDVSNPESIQSAFQQVSGNHQHIDVLINNAGILKDGSNTILDIPFNTAIETLQTNALGALWTTQIFHPLLTSGSRVIMVSSGLGEFCNGVSDYAPIYSISKTTLNTITKHLDKALIKTGIIINAICPGWVKSDMGGQEASRTLEQGADTIVWLATDAPDTIHGQFLRDRKPISW